MNMDNNSKSDFADKVYNAAKTADRYNSYDLNETVVDAPFFTLGEYTYVLYNIDQIAMFPYRMDDSDKKGGPTHTRPHWLEGVVIDNQLVKNNPGMFDKGGRNGKPGFPHYRIMSILRDIENLRDIMGQLDIKNITG